MYQACSIGNLRFVKYLANELRLDIKGMFTEHIDYESKVLCNACSSRNEKLVRWLINYGFDVNKEYDGETPLLSACRNGYQHIVELLVSCGADINGTHNIGDTPLFCAWWNRNENLIKWLIEHGADINKSWNGHRS